MIKSGFTAWDFVKQEPKKEFTIDGGTLISDYTSWTIGDGSFTNTIVFGDNVTITDGMANNRVYISDLTVQGSAEIPPREGDMRTMMGEDGYWLTQVFNISLDSVTPNNPSGDIWVTISRTESMITAGETLVPTQRVSIWTKFKNLFKSRA